jgi:hypothetical protein
MLTPAVKVCCFLRGAPGQYSINKVVAAQSGIVLSNSDLSSLISPCYHFAYHPGHPGHPDHPDHPDRHHHHHAAPCSLHFIGIGRPINRSFQRHVSRPWSSARIGA